MDYKEEIKNRLAIEDVVGEYLELKRAGRNFSSKSPFTNEKTASFIVSPEKRIWHDFSSGKGGDIFSFVMEIEGVDFKEALEILAKKAGVEIIREPRYQKTIPKERLYLANEVAANYFQENLLKYRKVVEYVVKTRKFNKETILKWRIGYSPNKTNGLIVYLKRQGFSDKEIEKAGLATFRYGKYLDIFRNRMTIPLFDRQGRVIGFTARILSKSQNKSPKYINTPSTVLYDKSRHIFGLNFAKQAIRQNKCVVICEGNLDVIKSHQIGVSWVVATAGTALTENHLKNLNLLTEDIRICFDSDRAGIEASERAIILASKLDLTINILEIEGAKDPDELINLDPGKWQKVVNNPIYGIDWYIKYLTNQYDLKKAPDKRNFSTRIIRLLSNLKDQVEKDHYINIIAKLINVDKQAVWEKLNSNQSNFQEKPKLKNININFQNTENKKQTELQKIQDNYLAIILFQKSMSKYLDFVNEEMFLMDASRQVFRIIQEANGDFDLRKNLAKFKNIQDYVKIEQLIYEEYYQKLDLNELRFEVSRLRSNVVEGYVKNQKILISKQLGESKDSKITRELLNRAKELDNLLHNTRRREI